MLARGGSAAMGTCWFLQAKGGHHWGPAMADQCGQTSHNSPRLPTLVSSGSSPKAAQEET